MEKDFAIAILAAGMGIRMKSRRAKVLHQAGGRTLIESVAATAAELAPAKQIHVVVGHQADEVRQALSGFGVGFITQREQRGTGHAVLVGREVLEKGARRLLILYGDTPLVEAESLAALVAQQVRSGAAATVLTTRIDNPDGYGRIVRDGAGELRAIVEHKDATPEQLAITEINSGIYCFQTAPLFEALAGLRPENRAGEYYLTDVIAGLAARGLPVDTFLIQDASQVLGINTRVELAQVDALLRARKARDLMLSGVTIERPETVTVDAGVEVGTDTVLEAFVQLRGRTRIGSGCRIRSHSIVSDSTLDEEVTVEPFSWINESVVERGARIGPYARLRTANHIEAGAQIGNFVELKKTRLGARSKAMHLAYLGDATIGSQVNIGAGTITCNYDGAGKHPTRIEDGAFVGSNSTLVAPLRIGEGAYLAAGSVLTEDVPPGSLGIARGRQSNKPGWAARRNKRAAEEKTKEPVAR